MGIFLCKNIVNVAQPVAPVNGRDERRILRRPMTAAARPAFVAIKGATD